jgi:hypothetical protein
MTSAPEDNERMQFGLRRILGVVTILAIACGAYAWYQYSQRGYVVLERLLSGDPSVTILSMDVGDGRRDVVCTDQEVLNYFEHQMRHAVRLGDHPNGSGYDLVLAFNLGVSVSTPMYATRDLWGVCVPGKGLEPGWPSHDVTIAEPMPAKARTILDFLFDESQGYGDGRRMIVAEGRPIEIVERARDMDGSVERPGG